MRGAQHTNASLTEPRPTFSALPPPLRKAAGVGAGCTAGGNGSVGRLRSWVFFLHVLRPPLYSEFPCYDEIKVKDKKKTGLQFHLQPHLQP